MKNVVFFEPKSWWKDDVYWLLKSSCFLLSVNEKYGLFWVKKLMEKIIFTDYWKVLVLNFLMMRNMVFFWVKKLMEKIIFTDYRKLFGSGKYCVFSAEKWMERWYLLVTEKLLFWTFPWWETRSFFYPKSWWKDDIYLVFWSFPWNFKTTWEIQLFVLRQLTLMALIRYFLWKVFFNPQ